MSALVIFTSTAFAGETDPAAKPYLERMIAIYEKAPMSMDFRAEMTIPSQEIAMKMKGEMVFLDQLHFRMEMEMQVKAPGQDEMMMDMFMVSDGEIFWNEVRNPPQPVMVTRMPMEEMMKMQESMGMKAFMGGGTMDPATMMEVMEQVMTIRLLEKRDGKVYLSGILDPEYAETTAANPMFGGQENPGDLSFLFVLDEANIYPMEMRMRVDETDFMVMTFGEEITYLDKATLPPDTFTYTPPEGVEVMDITSEIPRQNQ
jgi:outer membrane lipoprotein-sorting protein